MLSPRALSACGVWRCRAVVIALLNLLAANLAKAAPREKPQAVTAPIVSAITPGKAAAGDKLRDQLASLSAGVSASEAHRLSVLAHRSAAELRRDYRAVGSPHFHNFLVNAGLKKRGLCHHWARDLGERLASLKLRTLVLHWGIARGGTLREHNAVVVTARGQPFARGIVLDAWRHSGRLFWTAVAADRYPWKEDPDETFAPTVRSHAGTRRPESPRLTATTE